MRIAFSGSFPAAASPTNTTGTLAIIMPSVVPAATAKTWWKRAARATVATWVLSPISTKKNETSVVGATATLELNAQSAEALALAKAQGDLSLTLRSYADIGEPSGAVSRSSSSGAGAAMRTASAQTSTVRVFRGGDVTAVPVSQ